MLGPCFNCLEMGHLRASCPKLPRQYPLSGVDKSIGVNKLNKEYMGSKEKGKCCNCIDVSGDNCPCVVMENNVSDNSEVRLRLEEESSELSMDLVRCWEIEQEGPQITDVQGHLGTKLEF